MKILKAGENRFSKFSYLFLFTACLLFLLSLSGFAQNKKPVTLDDYAQWKTLSRQKISNNGEWLVYVLTPNEGNKEVVIRNLDTDTEYIKIKGDNPEISNDSKWVAFTILPEDSLSDDAKKKIKNGMGLVELNTGSTVEVDSISSFSFSEDGKWLAFKYFEKKEKKPKKKETAEEKEKPEKKEEKGKDKKKKEKKPGTKLILRNLRTGTDEIIEYVSNFTMDKDSKFLVYSVSAKDDKGDGLYARELKENGNLINLCDSKGKYLKYSWSEDKNSIAFVSDKDDAEAEIPVFDLYVWDTDKREVDKVVVSANLKFPEGMIVSENGNLNWSEDGKKLFFGIAPKKEKELTKEEKEKLPDVDVWHWKDTDLQPQQRVNANRNKNRTYTAVYHIDNKKALALGNREFERIQPSPYGKNAVAVSQKLYNESIPWRFPNFSDYYIMDTKTGAVKKIIEKGFVRPSWSPKGNYLVYYHEKNWWLYDVKKSTTTNLTKDMDVPFWNIDDDHPDTKREYGGGYWLKDDEGVLIYDKYDIWMFPVKKKGNPVNITGGKGRSTNSVFRYISLDREEKFIDPSKKLILSYFNRMSKASGYFYLKIGDNNPEKFIRMDKRVSSLQKAKEADRYIMTVQTFEEFPNVYFTDGKFSTFKKVTDANPQQKDYAWGHNELIEWLSMDGKPLQGILTYPANYEPGRKYPMVVYIYERLSDGFHVHYIPLANHRFNAAVYASNGYAVFKPDIVYDIGHPGQSSVKCIVPGIQKIIEMGVADPEKIGLQGHSWGGYETAYIITQTDLFAAAISGAPVSNMTSAYGGIRWGSGLLRQFQYERTQSRIGGSLWEYPELYIENSPLFFCDRVNTPLLILHGDDDGAVPWYQGIELFAALRRLGKDVIMLQYNGEPHHLRKKKNKDDFTKKMWEYYEHYLRGKESPEWIKNGVPYLEKGTK